jgi:hypothetical protein
LLATKWINWGAVNHCDELQEVEKKFHDIGLHRLAGTRQNWHTEMIKQFFCTFYIDPSRTSLTWMTGRNRKISVTKRYCELVLLDPMVHDGRNVYPKIKDQLNDMEKEELRSVNKVILHAANRVVRNTILPKAGDRSNIHTDSIVVLYHVLFGKAFDFVDMMLRQIQKTRSDTRMLIPYAPYMLLINHATGVESVPNSRGKEYTNHPEYKINTLVPKQTKNSRGAKSKKSFRVPPLTTLAAPEQSEPVELSCIR